MNGVTAACGRTFDALAVLMRFLETKLGGVYLIEVESKTDHRGFFARGFCEREFAQQGLETHFVQWNISWNKEAGTLRGLHYQLPPYAEAKIMRCIRGRIFVVAVDLRPESPTYCQWLGVELSAQNHSVLYSPPLFAYGYQSLEPDTEVLYAASAFYEPGAERGIRWNDPLFHIEWPLTSPILSAKDQAHLDFQSTRQVVANAK